MLSQTGQYALRAALHLAAIPPPATMGVAELAEALDLPQNYLSKVLHQLARAGVLISARGKGGGFRLARPAEKITLLEVLELFDGVGPRTQCLLGRPVCSDAKPCPAHQRWSEISQRMVAFFRESTLAQLAGSI